MKPKSFQTIEIEKAIEKNLTMRLDLVYFDGEPFLATITNPLNFFTCDQLTNGKTTAILAKLITEKILMCRGEGFSIHNVLCDNEPTLLALEPTLGSGIKLITAEIKSNHIASLDRAIKFLKDRVRTTLASSPYVLPKPLLRYAIVFVTHNLNLLAHSHSPSFVVSPRELLTGRKTDVNIDFRIAFGA
jgi:hypothetical protein